MKMPVLMSLFIIIVLSTSAQSVQKITILHTNDLHSRLNGYSPESAYTPLTVNDDNTTGGFARIATIIKEEQERADGTLLVLDGGDFLMGTLFQGLEEKTGFQLRLMKRMGYDVACLGNHEFDYGPAKLSSIVTNSARKGEIPGLLLSNIVFDEKDFNDDSLEALFAKKIIGDKIVVMRDGLKIGFFSLLGKVADDNAAYATPVTFSKQIPFARKMVDELKKEKCDLIICLSHSGVLKNSEGEWDGEDVDLAKRVRGIDLIISGHTHSKLIEPVIVNGTPIVQTGEYGQFVGKLSLSFSNGNVSVSDYSLIPVDDRIPGDPLIHRLIEEQEEVVTSEILKPLGLDSDTPVAEAEFLLECNEQGDIEGSNLGPMVADAIHHYVNRHRKEGTDISMVAVGVIRDKIVPGLQTAPDIFKIMSMGSGNDDTPGYPLATLYVTGRELKHILEILQIAYKSTPGNYCYYSGVKVGYDPDKMIFKKIKKIEVIHPNGTTSFVDFSKRNKTLYSITANSYMLEFIGIIKKMSFGLINVTPKDSDGNRVREMRNAIIDTDINRQGVQEGKEWLALLELLASMKDNNGNGIPEIDRKYSIPIKSFFLLK